MTIPGSIAVLATLAEFKRNGFGTAALKVALLYMKEHYVHRNVQVLADTFEDYLGDSADGYWENIGFKFSDREPVVRKRGDTESVCR
jgi:GNAT superfamily N-acetyltransferase